jgi:hypothetical protein
MSTRRAYYPEQTVSRRFNFEDVSGTLTDPDSSTCEVYDPTHTSQATPTLTKINDGVFEMNYTLPNNPQKGDWMIVVTGTIGSYKGIQKFYFEVELLP